MVIVIPAGPLRENLNKIKNYKYIFINGNLENLDNIKNTINKYKSNNLRYLLGMYIPTNINEFRII